MKNMASLMKIELILMKRQAAYYLLSIGLPSVFYLIFSGMMSGSNEGWLRCWPGPVWAIPFCGAFASF